jgi:hypothetical protein
MSTVQGGKSMKSAKSVKGAKGAKRIEENKFRGENLEVRIKSGFPVAEPKQQPLGNRREDKDAAKNSENQNLKNAISSVISMGYESKNVRKMRDFRGEFWVRKGLRFYRKFRRDKDLILD